MCVSVHVCVCVRESMCIREHSLVMTSLVRVKETTKGWRLGEVAVIRKK